MRRKPDGSLKSPAYITALHNGVLILNHFELKGDTPFVKPPSYTKHADKLPIRLQDHGNAMRFRNIWVREFRPAEGLFRGGLARFQIVNSDARQQAGVDVLRFVGRHDQDHGAAVPDEARRLRIKTGTVR